MGYRIEAVQPAVVDAVRRYGEFKVNGVPFRLLEGRAISDPVPEAAVGLFDVPGYLLVREEPPYERVSELGQEAMRLELDQALREGTLPPEALTGGGEEGSLEGKTGAEEGGLEAMTKAQLLALARERGLEVNDRMTKAELLGLLKG